MLGQLRKHFKGKEHLKGKTLPWFQVRPEFFLGSAGQNRKLQACDLIIDSAMVSLEEMENGKYLPTHSCLEEYPPQSSTWNLKNDGFFFFHFLSPLDLQQFIPPELQWLGWSCFFRLGPSRRHTKKPQCLGVEYPPRTNGTNVFVPSKGCFNQHTELEDTPQTFIKRLYRPEV